jgi:hypothetical protein
MLVQCSTSWTTHKLQCTDNALSNRRFHMSGIAVWCESNHDKAFVLHENKSVFILFTGTVNLNSNTVNGLPNSHNSTSSSTVNGVSGGTVHRTSSMNGQYMDTSPSGQYADQREYVNGANSYSSSQVRQTALPVQTSIRSVVKELHKITLSVEKCIYHFGFHS